MCKSIFDRPKRSDGWAYPGGMKPGDVLACGCRVVDTPIQLGNGGVGLRLASADSGRVDEIRFAARSPIALAESEPEEEEG